MALSITLSVNLVQRHIAVNPSGGLAVTLLVSPTADLHVTRKVGPVL